jgi:hypothetical protein
VYFGREGSSSFGTTCACAVTNVAETFVMKSFACISGRAVLPEPEPKASLYADQRASWVISPCGSSSKHVRNLSLLVDMHQKGIIDLALPRGTLFSLIRDLTELVYNAS